jgi:metal-responsive CopG/Arc/MetJ family transcriptional regulator
MKRKVKIKKVNASITLDPNVLEIVDSNFSNRSKFIESIIIEELSKNELFKEELKKIKVIL